MRILFSFLLILLTIGAKAQISKVKVIAVQDAQVLTGYSDEYRDTFNIILGGMICPGLDQPYGKEARELVVKEVLGKTVRIEPLDAGDYGLMGVIFAPGGKTLDELLIVKGLAKADDRETEWLKLQEKAQAKKLGIWKDGTAVDLEKDWQLHHPVKISKKDKRQED